MESSVLHAQSSMMENTLMSTSNNTKVSCSSLSRKRMKEKNPEKYQLYLEAQRKRAKMRRDQLKKELQKKKEDAIRLKEHILELQRARQRRYVEKQRNRKKEINSFPSERSERLTPGKKSKARTRHSLEAKREYNREMKRKERKSMSWQKKMWVRKKDRERKEKKRDETKKQTATCNTGSPFSSKKTEYNVTYKVKSALPSTPKKFAKVIHNILSKASPRKKDAFGMKSSKPAEIAAKMLLKKSIKYRRSVKNTRQSKVDVLGIRKFYLYEDVSRVLPQKRYATKEGPGYVMQVSLRAAHKKYLQENPTKYVSFGKFAALRTRNVRLLKVSHRQFCCCIYCINVRYKMLCLSKSVNNPDRKNTCEAEIGDFVLCPKRDGQQFHEPECIDGKCSKCKDYVQTLQEHYIDIPEEKSLTWLRWESEKYKDGKCKKVLITKTGNKQECLREFADKDILHPSQGVNFFQHFHTAKWQAVQFNNIKKDLPKGTTLQVMDFAKNREIKYQDEIKSAYYTANQITMHPIVTYFKTDIGLKRHSIIVISEDNTHDHHAVHHFQKLVDQEVEKEIGQEPKRKIIFSDGCSSQYKSKGPFADLAHEKEKTINRNYFGSEHGKNDCDAEIGVINQAVDRAIVANKALINNGKDLYDYCKKNLEIEDPFSKRTFLFVRVGEVNRERPETKVRTIPNTRKIHQMINVQTKQDIVKVRNLSCFCRNCELGNKDCLNSKYVNQYETKQIIAEKYSGKSTEAEKHQQNGRSDKSKLAEKPHLCRSASNLSTTTKMEPCEHEVSQVPQSAEASPNVRDILESAQTSTMSTPRSCTPLCSEQPIAAVSSLTAEAETHEIGLLWEKMAQCNSYEDLQQTVLTSEIPQLPKPPDVTFFSHKRTVDESALLLMSDDLKQCGLFPSTIYGDGNCLPRCASLLVYGSEDFHVEMRTRIICELVTNEEKYLDDNYLAEGADPASKSNVAKNFAMFSEHFNAEKLTPLAIQRIFRNEIQSICTVGTYMGIWQIAALANVLGRDTVSVYSSYGGKTVRNQLNRMFVPLKRGKLSSKQIYIMWSNLHGCRESERVWSPNHFVPLLKMCSDAPSVVEDEVEELNSSFVADLFDDGTEDVYLNSSIVNNIIQELGVEFHDNEGVVDSDELMETDDTVPPDDSDVPVTTEDKSPVHATSGHQVPADDNTMFDRLHGNEGLASNDLVETDDTVPPDDSNVAATTEEKSPVPVHATSDHQVPADDNTMFDRLHGNEGLASNDLVETDDTVPPDDSNVAATTEEKSPVPVHATSDHQVPADDNTMFDRLHGNEGLASNDLVETDDTVPPDDSNVPATTEEKSPIPLKTTSEGLDFRNDSERSDGLRYSDLKRLINGHWFISLQSHQGTYGL